eukprot:SAG22_NODE_2736_length_2264_cov_5.354273_2_plen_540_part_00
MRVLLLALLCAGLLQHRRPAPRQLKSVGLDVLNELKTEYPPSINFSGYNHVKIDAFRNLLIAAGFSYSKANPRAVAAETAAARSYQTSYLRAQIGNRKRGLDSVEHDHTTMALQELEGSPGRASSRNVLQKKGGYTRGEGWRKPWVTLDESYVTVNHVARKTLFDKANNEQVNRRDGAGPRVCIGGAVVYHSGDDDIPHAEFAPGTAGFFMFRAKGGKSGANMQVPGPKKSTLEAALVTLRAAKTGNKLDLMSCYVSALANVTDRDHTPEETALAAECTKAIELFTSTQELNPGGVDHFDYHGNFDAERFTKWFTHLCEELQKKYGACEINMDGASYHKLRVDPPPTSGSNRAEIIAWLERRERALSPPPVWPPRQLITEADKADSRGSGLKNNELLDIVKANSPAPVYEVFGIAATHGHHVQFTPPYCHRSAPIEIVWANLKNPIGRLQGAETINDLMSKIQNSKNAIKESVLLGAYADTRQWENEMWLQDPLVVEGEMPVQPDNQAGDLEDDLEDADGAIDPEAEADGLAQDEADML